MSLSLISRKHSKRRTENVYGLACELLSKKMLNIIRSIHESVLCCARASYDYTNVSECPTGMKQGCLLSPKLSCLFIDEVAEELTNDRRHGTKLTTIIEIVFSLLIAVHVALVSHTVIGLQKPLNVVIRASNRICLTVDLEKEKEKKYRKKKKKKTKVMAFRKKGSFSKVIYKWASTRCSKFRHLPCARIRHAIIGPQNA